MSLSHALARTNTRPHSLWHAVARQCRHPTPSPLHALLLWQTCTLAWLAGLLAARWPWAALVCLGCVYVADSRLWRPLPGLFAGAVFALGFAVCQALLPTPQPLPDWAKAHPAPRLTATVARVQGLPDNRLRVLLQDVRPAGDAAATPIPKVSWTWDTPAARPLPGQRVELTLPLHPVTGLRNPGVSDIAQWWGTQGIFTRLWSRGMTGQPHISGDAWPGAATRWTLEHDLVRALGGGGTEHDGKDRGEGSKAEGAKGAHAKVEWGKAGGGQLSQAQAFIPALLFGDRTYLSAQTSERMAGAGLAHSLALSGQHLALAGLLALVLVRLCAWRRPQIYLAVPRLKLAALLSVPLALLYLWLGGAPGSLVRASCMLAVAALLLWRDNLRTGMDALGIAVLAIALAWPLGIFDTGLQLSVLCVAALALFAPWLRRVPTPAARTPARTLWRGVRGLCLVLLASCIIQLALLPVFLLLFGYISPWFISNVLWLPVLGIIVLPCAALGTLLLALGADTLAQAALWCATLPCGWLLDGLDALARAGAFEQPALLRPHWTALPAWAALMTALALAPGRAHYPAAGKRLLLVGIALLCVGPALRIADALSDSVRLTVLDVGQGQAVSLRLPGGQTLLVDGGGTSSRFDVGRAVVAPNLSYNTAPRLAHVVNSHPDVDHSRGLAYILRAFDVGQFWHNGHTPTAPDVRQMLARHPGQTLHAGYTLELGQGLRLEVLHPPPGTDLTGNNASLVLRLVRDGRGLALLPGDAELAALRALLESGQDLRADVLILPHHGSRGSLLPALYDAVAPSLALVSCGQGNRYGYPARDVVRALTARNITLRSTAQEGALEVRWDGRGKFEIQRD